MFVCCAFAHSTQFALIPIPTFTLSNPYRANSNWQSNYASLTKSAENSSPTSNKKQRDAGDQTARDSVAYSCLLRNELLGNGIEDVKTVADERNENVPCNAKRGLFKYQSPTKQVIDWVIRVRCV